MSEILTRERALEALKHLRDAIDPETMLYIGTINPALVDYAIEALEITLYGGDDDDRWILVSERLPKEKGYYLITRKNPNGHVTKVSYDPSRVERGVYNSPWGHGDADVLAWMPLPKPYKEDNE